MGCSTASCRTLPPGSSGVVATNVGGLSALPLGLVAHSPPGAGRVVNCRRVKDSSVMVAAVGIACCGCFAALACGCRKSGRAWARPATRDGSWLYASDQRPFIAYSMPQRCVLALKIIRQ